MGVSRFEIFVGVNNMMQYRLVGPKDDIILTSKTFPNQDRAMAEIREIKEAAPFAQRYDMKADNGKLFFQLKSASHKVLGTSALFEKSEDRESALAVVRRAGEAAVMTK